MSEVKQLLAKNIFSSGNDDINGFNILYEEYYTKLLTYSNSYVHSMFIAKDIVQDSFINLWEKRAKLSPETNIRYYLFVVVRNRSLNYLKHKKVESQFANDRRADYLSAELSHITMEYDGSDLLLGSELKEIIDETISDLPEKCRAVFELSRKENKKNKEIAEELTISVKTVEAQITKGLKCLRKRLGEYFD